MARIPLPALWTEESLASTFTDLMRLHYADLYDYGLKLTGGNEELTKDAIQDVFLALWHRREEWRSIASVKAYLLVSLRHKLVDYLRTRQRFTPAADPESTSFTFSPEDFLIREHTEADRSACVATLLNRLPRRQREAIYLRFYNELDYADVARAMGVTERTVYNLVHEGLTKLRHALSPALRALLASSLLGALLAAAVR